jgi:hypothetical protein
MFRAFVLGVGKRLLSDQGEGYKSDRRLRATIRLPAARMIATAPTAIPVAIQIEMPFGADGEGLVGGAARRAGAGVTRRWLVGSGDDCVPEISWTSSIAVRASPFAPDFGLAAITALSATSRPPLARPAPCGITTNTRPE